MAPTIFLDRNAQSNSSTNTKTDTRANRQQMVANVDFTRATRPHILSRRHERAARRDTH